MCQNLDVMAQGDPSSDTLDLKLAFEYCDCNLNKEDTLNAQQFSFCSDGHEQYFGLPVFVRLNFNDCYSTYSKPIYYFTDYKTSSKWIDSINKIINYENIFICNNNKLRQIVLRNFKRANIPTKFDGNLYYGLFKVRIVIGSMREVNRIIPNFNARKKKDDYAVIRKIDGYVIKDILSIEPITREEYFR